MANKSLKRKLDDITQSDEPKDSEEPQTKKQKLNLGSDQQENSSSNSQNNENIIQQVDLPPEILVTIFCQLSRADLARAAGVCQRWWLVSQDESLSWALLKAFQFMEDERAYAQYSKLQSQFLASTKIFIDLLNNLIARWPPVIF